MALNNFDNVPANAFAVTIDGIKMPRVIEVSGLKLEVGKIEAKQQTEDGKYVASQMPGRQITGELKITRGCTENQAISNWIKTVMEGDVAGARKTVGVELKDTQGNTLKTYNFVNCWVKSVEVDKLTAGATEQAKETFVICYDGASVS